MAEHERAARDKQADAENKRRVKQQEPQPALDEFQSGDRENTASTETPFHPRMNEHAAILSRIPYTAQRHEFILRLNDTYGYRYAQRLVEAVNAQAKLTVSDPNDVYEQEADRVAEEVSRSINTTVGRQVPDEEEELQMQEEEDEEVRTTPVLQRQVSEEEEELQAQLTEGGPPSVSGYIESSINGARGGGHPLVDEVREPMERAFGADFSGVRAHTNAEADTLNRELSAKAFTTGHDVFFREGEYSPGSDSGRKLLAHELTHVVQQTGSRQPQRLVNKKNTAANAGSVNFGSGKLRSPWDSPRPAVSRNLFASGAGSVHDGSVVQRDFVFDPASWKALPNKSARQYAATQALETAKRLSARAQVGAGAATKGNTAEVKRYEEWFGPWDKARRDTVRGNYRSISTGLDRNYTVFADVADPDDYAYVFPARPTEIYLGNQFFVGYQNKAVIDSTAGTIVHEVSHLTCNTDDHEYGQGNCRDLAVNNPAKAVNNADNYLYYSESF